jgi:transcriptional regulator with XRE-family HTH domain
MSRLIRDFWLNAGMASKLLSARENLSANLRVLMQATPDLDSQPKIAKRSGVSQSTVGRLIRGDVRCKLDSLDGVARAFGLAAWQLLVPDLDPTNPPVLRELNHHERELYERIRAAAQELAQYAKEKP